MTYIPALFSEKTHVFYSIFWLSLVYSDCMRVAAEDFSFFFRTSCSKLTLCTSASCLAFLSFSHAPRARITIIIIIVKKCRNKSSTRHEKLIAITPPHMTFITAIKCHTTVNTVVTGPRTPLPNFEFSRALLPTHFVKKNIFWLFCMWYVAAFCWKLRL